MATIQESVEVDIDIDEYLDEASEEALLDELRKRRLRITDEDLQNQYIPSNLEGETLKRFICTLLDTSFAISTENLLSKLNDRLTKY